MNIQTEISIYKGIYKNLKLNIATNIVRNFVFENCKTWIVKKDMHTL